MIATSKAKKKTKLKIADAVLYEYPKKRWVLHITVPDTVFKRIYDEAHDRQRRKTGNIFFVRFGSVCIYAKTLLYNPEV